MRTLGRVHERWSSHAAWPVGSQPLGLPHNASLSYWAARSYRLPLGFRVKQPPRTFRSRSVATMPRAAEVAVLVKPGILTPQPNSKCTNNCSSSRGTCVSLFADIPELETTQCLCHEGFRGRACELAVEAVCVNGCTGHGRCLGRLCHCDAGWWGFDCSLSQHNARVPVRASPHTALKYTPTYVYPLPTEWGLFPSVHGIHGGPRGKKFALHAESAPHSLTTTVSSTCPCSCLPQREALSKQIATSLRCFTRAKTRSSPTLMRPLSSSSL